MPLNASAQSHLSFTKSVMLLSKWNLCLLLALNYSVRELRFTYSPLCLVGKLTSCNGVNIYIFSSYFYSDSLHEHSMSPGSLRRKQFLQSSCRVILKHAQQWCYAAVTYVGVLQTMKGLNNNFDIAHLETEL